MQLARMNFMEELGTRPPCTSGPSHTHNMQFAIGAGSGDERSWVGPSWTVEQWLRAALHRKVSIC